MPESAIDLSKLKRIKLDQRATSQAGLFSRHAGQKASTLTVVLDGQLLEWPVKRKADGAAFSRAAHRNVHLRSTSTYSS